MPVLVEHLAGEHDAAVQQRAQRATAPPLQLSRVVVEPDLRDRVLRLDLESPTLHHPSDGAEVDERVGHDDDLRDPAGAELGVRRLKHVVRVQIDAVAVLAGVLGADRQVGLDAVLLQLQRDLPLGDHEAAVGEVVHLLDDVRERSGERLVDGVGLLASSAEGESDDSVFQ